MLHFDDGVPRRQLTGHVLWFGSWLFVTAAGLYLTPSAHGHGTHTQLGLPPCPSVMLFQRPCPGCGLTTSFTSFLHGHFGQAFIDHPFGPIFYLTWTASAIACLYGFVKSKRFNTDSRAWNWSLGGLTMLFFVFGMWRFFASPYPLNWVEERLSSPTTPVRSGALTKPPSPRVQAL